MAPIRGFFSALVGLFLAACVAGAAGGFMIYQHFSAGLPDVDGLRGYQPPVMSRVYANDGRLLAELATERRIFVPINAVPEMYYWHTFPVSSESPAVNQAILAYATNGFFIELAMPASEPTGMFVSIPPCHRAYWPR